jgi:hypothetical protein
MCEMVQQANAATLPQTSGRLKVTSTDEHASERKNSE